MSLYFNTQATKPADYIVPPFPSLYWPFPIRTTQPYVLYDVSDIWRFTLYWTLLCYAALHLATSGYAVALQIRSWKVIWIVPLLYAIVGGIEAVISATIVGILLGGIYTAADFPMSTWIPFVWALIQSLVLILSSYAIEGGL